MTAIDERRAATRAVQSAAMKSCWPSSSSRRRARRAAAQPARRGGVAGRRRRHGRHAERRARHRLARRRRHRRHRHRRGRRAGRRSRRSYQAAETIEARDEIVLPGLINTHTHAPMVMYRGLADDLALMDWLQKYIFPAEAKTVSPEIVRIGTRLAALEMIESGTTTFADMYYFEEEIAKATRRSRAARRARPDDHSVSGRRRENAGRRAGARRSASSRSSRTTAWSCRPWRRTRCTPTTATTLRGVAPSSAAATACRCSSISPRPRTKCKIAREQYQGDAGGVPGIDRLLGPEHAGGARRSG